jgi:hypothetical protein
VTSVKSMSWQVATRNHPLEQAAFATRRTGFRLLLATRFDHLALFTWRG